MRMMPKGACALPLIVAALAATPSAAQQPGDDALMAELFSDHAVLQRDRPILVWGRAGPSERVEVSLGDGRDDIRGVATADAEGAWRVSLPARGAGGPYVLTAQAGDRREVARDVLIGDVYLCSGQSNMVLGVDRALNSPREIAASADAEMRLLTIQTDSALAPLDAFVRPVAWAPAAPETVAPFSAACFFFAQDLRRDDTTPIGLINAAWGGSTIQAWMSEPALRAVGDDDVGLDILNLASTDPRGAQARWGEVWENAWRQVGPGEPWAETSDADWTPVPSLTAWETWGVPELAAYNGMVWYRTDLELTEAQARQGATLSLGPVDEADQTWVNGRPVGASGSGERMYALPAGALRAGRNTIVLNVLDTYANGGLYGPADKRVLTLDDGTAVPLDAQGWRYRVAGNVGAMPRAPWESLAGLTTISNAMIAPLEGYGLNGVLWYQGESNTSDRPERYGELLTGLMADWRARFDAPELGFLVVSLANHGEPRHRPAESGWAELRDQVRRAVKADDRAEVVMAVDLGDRWDIHPGQKLELGRRLARAARHLIRGQPLAPSGPEVASARRDGDEVVVMFDHVSDELLTWSSDRAIGFELCGGGVCRFVDARPQGASVRLAVPEGVEVDEVRYAWADNPTVNLFDAAGLPAGPFRLTLP